MEMSQAFRRLGSDVAVIDYADTILGKDDKELTNILKDSLQKEGIQFYLNTSIHKIEKRKGTIRVFGRNNSSDSEIEVDGENVLNGHKLVVNGNESQEIKGFMKNMNKTNKFKFINKTEEIQEHRGDRIDDGMVRVTYQFEQAWSCYQPYIVNYSTTPTVSV